MPIITFCRNILGQLAEAMPQAVTVTPEEREAIERVRFSFFSMDSFVIYSCGCSSTAQSIFFSCVSLIFGIREDKSPSHGMGLENA